MPKLSSSLQDIIAPVIEGLGYEFWADPTAAKDLVHLLRIYIDKLGGINVDDCQRVSRQLSAILDVEDTFSHQYVLEVSSPGIDRPLFTIAQFERYVGNSVRLKIHTPINGQTHFVGEIQQVIGDKIFIKIDDNQQLELAFPQIERANLKIMSTGPNNVLHYLNGEKTR